MKRVNVPRTLSPDERQLWEKVKKTAQPLDRDAITIDEYLVKFNGQVNTEPPPSKTRNATSAPPGKGKIIKPYSPEPKNQPVVVQSLGSAMANRIEQKTTRKIAKGRISIEGRIDLHGLTQLEAHGRLFRYLEEAWMREKRTILVITGKGKGEGILRQAVPRWLSEPSFCAMISGINEASQSHGGQGALYVRLKRRKQS